ncbi:tyrosine-type recombinase/integrase [Brevibacillus brevis]|uniref:tyrosine-type recombinase/integrase n=1 Tax=Brevibacillus brevis TaxID=1393 RepID=UPI0033952A7F
MNRELGWTDNERITPHGFRATISTILSERGVDISAIKFLLGHSERDNIQYYIRRFQRHINQLKKSLTQIEDELIQGTTNGHVLKNIYNEDKSQIGENRGLDLISKDVLLKLIQADPDIAVSLIQRGLRHM